uniref:Natural cytotoxicity triggering receptor 3 n=1 Tax=Ginglymostoma cirratum TaxID=7801 RepID=A0A8A9WRC0_GINCI|nr:natural cytotoxicity triggering receptor 3 [Ginglymostoma cirratum]
MVLRQLLTLMQSIIFATSAVDTKMNVTVFQFPPFITVTEGESVTLNCALDIEGTPILVGAVSWTRGKPDGYKLDDSPFYAARLRKSDGDSFAHNRIFINISDLIEKDSDTYYCRVSVMGREGRDGNGTKLEVKRKEAEKNSGNNNSLLGLGGAVTLLVIIVMVLMFGLIQQNKAILRLKRDLGATNTTYAVPNLQRTTQVRSNRGSDQKTSICNAKVSTQQKRTMERDPSHVEYATIY